MQEVADTVGCQEMLAAANTVVYLAIPVVVRIVGDAAQQVALDSRELVGMDYRDMEAGH
jgi:hypothetical protein